MSSCLWHPLGNHSARGGRPIGASHCRRVYYLVAPEAPRRDQHRVPDALWEGPVREPHVLSNGVDTDVAGSVRS